MNKSGIWLLVFAISIATLTIWLNSYWVSNKGFEFIQKEKKIDYYLSDFTLLDIQADGSMRYSIKGKHLIHQQSTKTTELIQPILKAQNSNKEITTITAKKAIQESKNGPIVLKGKVDVNKGSHDPSQSIQFITHDLIYNPSEKTLKTDAKIILNTGFIKMQGVGMISKLDEQEIRILSDVQSKIQTTK